MISAGCLGQVQQAVGSQQKGIPSLRDTEHWIDQTFTSENVGLSSCSEFDSNVPESDYGADVSCLYQSYRLDFADCKVTLFVRHSHTLINSARNLHEVGIADPRLDYVLSFKLSDIDPITISATAPIGSFGPLNKKTYHPNLPYVAINFRSTNDENNMVLSKPGGTSSIQQHDCCNFGGGIAMEPNYAPRFVHALRNAVELCGGKTSTF